MGTTEQSPGAMDAAELLTVHSNPHISATFQAIRFVTAQKTCYWIRIQLEPQNFYSQSPKKKISQDIK